MEVTVENFGVFLQSRPAQEKSRPLVRNGSWLEVWLMHQFKTDDVIIADTCLEALVTSIERDVIVEFPLAIRLFCDQEREQGSLTATEAIEWLNKAVDVAKKFTS